MADHLGTKCLLLQRVIWWLIIRNHRIVRFHVERFNDLLSCGFERHIRGTTTEVCWTLLRRAILYIDAKCGTGGGGDRGQVTESLLEYLVPSPTTLIIS